MIRTLAAIPVGQRSLATEATEYATRVQERERVMLVAVSLVFGALLSWALFGRRG